MDAIIVRDGQTGAVGLLEPRDLFGGIGGLYEYEGGSIPMDMYESKDELVLRAELPGFRKEDIDISLETEMLTVKAVKKEEEMPEGARPYLDERYFGEYTRTLTLPFPVETEKILANFENGVLEVRLPKAEEAKPKHIEVKVK